MTSSTQGAGEANNLAGRYSMSEALSVADVLDRAADLIEPEGAWTQGCSARDEHGNDIEGFDAGDAPLAACFCMTGAIWRVTAQPWPAARALEDVLHTGDIPEWNDAPERTQAEVVAKLREAAAKAREQSA